MYLFELEFSFFTGHMPRSRVAGWYGNSVFSFLRTLLLSIVVAPIYNPTNSVQFSRSVVSDSLWSHESQHTRPPCPSPTPGVHSNSCPSNRWCHPAISSLLLLPPIPPSIRVFSNESILLMKWPKYWSFSFSIIPSKEHPGLISFGMDWLDLLAVQGTLKSSPTPQFKSINSSALSLLHSPTLTSIHDHWKN